MEPTSDISCSFCLLKFCDKSQLLEHMKDAHKMATYKCNKCKISFPDKLQLIDHQAIHEISDTDNFSCDQCTMKFVSLHYLKSHVRDVHSHKSFSCDICGRLFRAQRYVNEHKAKVHSGKEKPKCPICNKEFRGKGELKTHSVIHTGERPYQCSICSKSFRARANLDVHMKIHNGRKDYACNICGRAFVVKNDLKRHLTIHLGAKDFGCSECGKSFNRKFLLEKHCKAVHEKNKTASSCSSPVSQTEVTNKSTKTFPQQLSLPLNTQNVSEKITSSSHLDVSLEGNEISEPSVNEVISEHFVVVMAPPTNNNELLLQNHPTGEKFDPKDLLTHDDNSGSENEQMMLLQREEGGEKFSSSGDLILTNCDEKLTTTELMLQNSEHLLVEQNSDIFLQDEKSDIITIHGGSTSVEIESRVFVLDESGGITLAGHPTPDQDNLVGIFVDGGSCSSSEEENIQLYPDHFTQPYQQTSYQ